MLALFAAGSMLAVPELPPLPKIQRAPQITYVDRAGAVLGVRGGRYGPPVNVARLPAYVPAAFVAIEDRQFYAHGGFDPKGIARAMITNLEKGRMAQGGSTITQQLARNLFLSNERTLERKGLELAYSIQLERTYSKAQILGMYLSRAYYGAGAYGLEAASQRYFAKPAARLSVREAAMLAAVMKSPTDYNPLTNPERSAQRTALVLAAMVETGAISPAQAAKAKAESPRLRAASSGMAAQYFIDWVDGPARAVMGKVTQDMVVETTLDSVLEAQAAASVRGVTARYSVQAALVAVDGAGRVKAMVGGEDYQSAPYNRAVSARRQAGSAWKPFVYLTALEAGRTPEDAAIDEPITVAGWSPQNYDQGFMGPISLETAFVRSLNTVAVRTADEVGRQNVAVTARRLGITSTVNTDPAMALGTTLVSPLEMAQAYSAFSNGGYRVNAYGIERVRTTAGKVVWARKTQPQVQVIANPALSGMNRMMRSVITSGTGARAKIAGYDLAAKTGTTSDYKDAWFAGFSGGFTTVVWMGRDDGRPTARITGGGAPAEAWRSFMSVALKRGAYAIPPGPPAPAPTPEPEPEPQLLEPAA